MAGFSMRSLLFTALSLTLFHTSFARVAHLGKRNAQPELKADRPAGPKKLFDKLIGRDLRPRQDNQTCYEDEYWEFATQLGPSFCQLFMQYPNVTVTVDYTPTSTVIITTTRVQTQVSLDRVTPTNTFTVTTTADGSNITPRALAPHAKIHDAFQRFRRQNAAASGSSAANPGDAALSVSFSSACSCQDYTGSIVTATYTNAVDIETLNAFVRAYTTIYTTRTAAPVVVTTTVIATPVSSSSEVSSSNGAASASSETESNSSTATAASSAGSESGNQTSPTSLSSESASANATATSAQSWATSEASGSMQPSTNGTAMSTSASVTQTATSTSSGGGSGPTAPPFTCPDDNNTTVSQMVGSERFDYQILCNTILGDDDLYTSFNYQTFGECVAACSVADNKFGDYPVCQGVSYYHTSSSSGGNCHLKKSANQTISAPGVDSALLQRIAIGVPSQGPEATITEVAPVFGGTTPTINPQDLSSSISSMMTNMSTVITITNPGPKMPVSGLLGGMGPITEFSTYISAGSTYSSGTTRSFYTSTPNGSWYSEFYYSYTVAWASATTVYGATETGLVAQNSTNSNTEAQTGEGGEVITITTTNTTTYTPEGYNVTEVIQYVTMASNGTEIGSTAVTSYFSVQTAAAGGGGSVGAPASAGAGPITSTAVYSTQTVIVNSGGTNGGTSFATGGGPPSQTETVVVSSGGTAFSTVIVVSGGTSAASGIAASGGGGQAGGGVSTAASGGPGPSTTVESVVTVISGSTGTGGQGGTAASGGAGGSGGAFSTAASGGPTSSPASTETQSVVTIISRPSSGAAGSGGTAASGGPSQTIETVISGPSSGAAGSSGTAASGGPSQTVETVISGTPSGTQGESGTAASGGPSPSSSTGFSISERPRSGTYSTTTTSPTESSGTESTATTSPSESQGTGSVPTMMSPATTGSSSSTETRSPLYYFTLTNGLRVPYYGPTPSPTSPESNSTTPIGTGPESSAPVSQTSASPSINATETGPMLTSQPSPSSSTGFSISERPRSGTYSTTTSATNEAQTTESPGNTLPTIATMGVYSPPPAQSSSPPTNETSTAPSGSAPSGTPSETVPASANSTAPDTGTSSGTTPSASSSTSTFSGSGTQESRTGLQTTSTLPNLPSGTGVYQPPPTTSAPAESTGPTTSTSTVYPTTCFNMTQGVTTMFETVTVTGCASTCLPWRGGPGGFYGGPQSFGPPLWASGSRSPSMSMSATGTGS